MSRSAAPSLLGAEAPTAAALAPPPGSPRTLVDLLYDGFYLLLLLGRGQPPVDEAKFELGIRRFLDEAELKAVRAGIAAADAHEAKYAFCAAIDEAVLASSFPIRDAWQRRPLQLQLFGEHLAGENFFARLEALRAQGASRLPALEVFHLCLLLGFKGKYRLEGTEKLAYLTARLGEEIGQLKGAAAPFAPHWALPDRTAHRLRRDVPAWAIGSTFAAFALVAFLGLDAWLDRLTARAMGGYANVVQVTPPTANVRITLP